MQVKDSLILVMRMAAYSRSQAGSSVFQHQRSRNGARAMQLQSSMGA